MRAFTWDVFGVTTKKNIGSYIRRKDVENNFESALKSHKQVVIYGSSKQGKTLLVRNHFPEDKMITVELSPGMHLTDLYRSILRQANVAVQLKYTEGKGSTLSSTFKSKFSAAVALVVKGEVEVGGSAGKESNKSTEYESISFNLSLPQDVGELLKKVKCNKTIVLENFHYLTEDNQRAFATDLRTFQDMDIQFIILGVWQDQNHLLQFNGDLVDRLAEVTVEPWSKDDFKKIISKGSKALNIKISDQIVKRCIDCSFKNVGIFQELIKETLINSGIRATQFEEKTIDSENGMLKAIESKRVTYGTRSANALEALATGDNIKSRDDKLPYFLNYYIVTAILDIGFEGIKKGLPKALLFNRIKGTHHRSAELKNGHLTRILNKISAVQNKREIKPPILSYDR